MGVLVSWRPSWRGKREARNRAQQQFLPPFGHDISRLYSNVSMQVLLTVGIYAIVAGLRVASFLCFSCSVIHVFTPTDRSTQGSVVEARLLGVESPLKCMHGTCVREDSVAFVREAVRVCSDSIFGTRCSSVPMMTLLELLFCWPREREHAKGYVDMLEDHFTRICLSQVKSSETFQACNDTF